MIVSIHIPKTAGTSLGHVLDYSSGRRVFWDYDPLYRNAMVLDPLVAQNLHFIKTYFKVIHGHFFNIKYASILPDATFVACLRHPVDRTVSHYYHVARLPGAEDWRTSLIRAGEMDVVDFATSDENLRLVYTNHLRGREIKDYDYIFFSENLQYGLGCFTERFGLKVTVPVPRMNTAPQRRSPARETIPSVTDAEREKLFRSMPEDVEIFRKAKEVFVHQHA